MAWSDPGVVNTGDVIVASWGNAVRNDLRYLKGSDGAFALDADITVTGKVTTTSDVVGGGLLKMGSGPATLTDATGKIVAIDSTRFASLSGANLTALPAAQLTGNVPAGTVSAIGNSTFPNTAGYLTAITQALVEAALSSVVTVQVVTLANGATQSLWADSVGGHVFLSVAGANIYGLFFINAVVTTYLSTFSAGVSTTVGVGASSNLYVTGGNVTLQNNSGSSRTYRIVRLTGG